jgi:hypothetical protein
MEGADAWKRAGYLATIVWSASNVFKWMVLCALWSNSKSRGVSVDRLDMVITWRSLDPELLAILVRDLRVASRVRSLARRSL